MCPTEDPKFSDTEAFPYLIPPSPSASSSSISSEGWSSPVPPSKSQQKSSRLSRSSAHSAWKTLYKQERYKHVESKRRQRILRYRNEDLTKQLAHAQDAQNSSETSALEVIAEADRQQEKIRSMEEELSYMSLQSRGWSWCSVPRSDRGIVKTDIRIWVTRKNISCGVLLFETSLDLQATRVGTLRAEMMSKLGGSSDRRMETNCYRLWDYNLNNELNDDYARLSSFGPIDWRNLRAREIDPKSKPELRWISPEERGKHIHVSACLYGQIVLYRFDGRRFATVRDLKKEIGITIGVKPRDFRLGFRSTELKDMDARLAAFSPMVWYLSVWQMSEPGVKDSAQYQEKEQLD